MPGVAISWIRRPSTGWPTRGHARGHLRGRMADGSRPVQAGDHGATSVRWTSPWATPLSRSGRRASPRRGRRPGASRDRARSAGDVGPPRRAASRRGQPPDRGRAPRRWSPWRPVDRRPLGAPGRPSRGAPFAVARRTAEGAGGLLGERNTASALDRHRRPTRPAGGHREDAATGSSGASAAARSGAIDRVADHGRDVERDHASTAPLPPSASICSVKSSGEAAASRSTGLRQRRAGGTSGDFGTVPAGERDDIQPARRRTRPRRGSPGRPRW